MEADRGGTWLITRPRRVRLSPTQWRHGYKSMDGNCVPQNVDAGAAPASPSKPDDAVRSHAALAAQPPTSERLPLSAALKAFCDTAFRLTGQRVSVLAKVDRKLFAALRAECLRQRKRRRLYDGRVINFAVNHGGIMVGNDGTISVSVISFEELAPARRAKRVPVAA